MSHTSEAQPLASDENSGPRRRGEDASILLVLPLAFRRDDDGSLMIESQAANGLMRWAENFDRVTVACVEWPRGQDRGSASWTWRRIDELPCADRIRPVPLPEAFKPLEFAREYRRVRKLLGDLIRDSRYLFFGISYTWGDWAALGCVEALRQKRPYAVWTDLVDYQVIRFAARQKSLPRRLHKQYVQASLVKHYHHYLIKRSGLGLFHGRDCFDAYAPLCRNPFVVHNIHLKPEDAIDPGRLEEKAREVQSGSPLRLGYVGRADPVKGGMDWLDCLKAVVDRGHDVRATWLGDGPILDAMRARAAELGLTDRVSLPGFVSGRGELLEFLRGCHAFLFCHKVPESPRNLIEAMVSGAPIVGYDSPYPRDLLADHDCGLLTPANDVATLAGAISGLDRDRERLASMIRKTAAFAAHYNDEAVFRHRGDLIKQYL
ncbi:2-deoxystreptamine glucosyltransferase [Aquisphaera giovannonii]|uniref:2-deoxystreptamine glucosyltransferase n=1 Tax=Aquisphaera giovannonii TaxID=406548 RepID=A0A5B9WAX5_9BACT|nr:glycosyltransferase [Aquisphaera giovannonii]QEH37399.1 2-deoxystreptamine glucosyltransferase [Aquisphaera giovannonii]